MACTSNTAHTIYTVTSNFLFYASSSKSDSWNSCRYKISPDSVRAGPTTDLDDEAMARFCSLDDWIFMILSYGSQDIDPNRVRLEKGHLLLTYNNSEPYQNVW